MKNHPVRAQLFHADRQTDMMMLTDAFHNFANTPTKMKDSKTVHCAK